MSCIFDSFNEIWVCDTEFKSCLGERQQPICLVAYELRSGREVKIWFDQTENPAPNSLPFEVGSSSLFVSYFASAELGTFLSLGWKMPERILDLYVEFRNLTSGKQNYFGNGLLGALKYFGLSAMDHTEKDRLRDMIISKPFFTEAEKIEILEYCATDVMALVKLFKAMSKLIDLPRALVRGRYMAAVAAMEHRGVPIDFPSFQKIKLNWEGIKLKLIQDVGNILDFFLGSFHQPFGQSIHPILHACFQGRGKRGGDA